MEAIPLIMGLGGAALSGVLALMALAQRPRTVANLAFAAGLALLAAEALCMVQSLRALTPEAVIGWQRVRMSLTGFVPAAWLLFSLVYARGNAGEHLRRWRIALLGAVVLPGVLVAGFNPALVAGLERTQDAPLGLVRLGWAGIALNVLFLLGCVLSLVHLERTFSASVGTMRWRLKFMMLGLGLLLGVRVYTSSQALVYSAANLALEMVDLLGLGLGCLLVGFSLLRARLSEIEVYPSRAVLHGSATVLLVGIYLVVLGLLAKVVAMWGGDVAFPIKAFLVLLALAGGALLVLSDRVRLRVRLAVSRHFRRPLYDYRQVWSQFTERTTSLMSREELCRAVARLISETFGSLSVTVWLVDEARQQLVFAASTLLAEDTARTLGGDPASSRAVLQALRDHPHPVDLDAGREPWLVELRKWNPDFFGKGGNRVCVPLVSGGDLLGLIALADRVSGLPFTVADLDLLKCIGDQVAAGLRNLQLSEQVLRAKEMEAFQTMSAFFVHDLKNVAYTLSLMLQNMARHFDNPEFRQDAMRSLERSLAHLNDLIARFGSLRQGMNIQRVETDLNEVVDAALQRIGPLPGVNLVRERSPVPKLQLDPEQMGKVVTNLVLNARDAVGAGGEIRVQTGLSNGRAWLVVADNGVGMSAEFIEKSLFRPFQTTKKNGLGIGMFHSKMIVEAHRGRIEVDSAPGQGTTFRVLLPIESSQP